MFKPAKKYIAMAFALALALFWKLNTFSSEYAQVETFRGANLEDEVFYPLMAENINRTNPVKVYINGMSYANNGSEVILSSELQPLASIGFVRDYLGCAAFMSDESGVTVQCHDLLYEITLGKRDAFCNGEEISLTQTPIEANGRVYLGLEDFCKFFEYDYGYIASDGIISIRYETLAELPDSYDLRDFGRVGEIKNQGSSSTCWAYASIGAFESSLRPMEATRVSVDDMLTHVSEGMKSAGDYTQAVAYLLSWTGPVVKAGEKPVYHLQNVRFYDKDEIGQIKRAVFRYGGVSTSIYASVSSSNLNTSFYYNKRTNSFYCSGDEKPNHEVVIIGWDDDYPAEYFTERPLGNGAFICQNSWGADFGESGVFYISYYDNNVGTQAVSYSGIDYYYNFDNIYQSDLQGWVGRMGYNKSSAYGANVFTAGANEKVEAAGFYAVSPNTSYKLYFVSNFMNKSSLANRELVASGKVDDAGFYTIRFDKPQRVNKGDEFAVILFIDTPKSQRPLAIEYQAGATAALVDLTDGKGYVSANGLDWTNIEEETAANLCIKAYSTNIKEVEDGGK